MIIYETARGDEVGVYDVDRFFARTETRHGVAFTRDELTQLRAIIDHALNTSAEELEASGE